MNYEHECLGLAAHVEETKVKSSIIFALVATCVENVRGAASSLGHENLVDIVSLVSILVVVHQQVLLLAPPPTFGKLIPLDRLR